MYKAVSGLPRGFAALVAVCLLCLPLIASADILPQAGKDAATGAVAGQVLVTFRDTADAGAVAHILRAYPPLSETAGLYRLAAPGGYADGHIARYTRASLTALLAQRGLTLEEVRYVGRGEMILALRRRH